MWYHKRKERRGDFMEMDLYKRVRILMSLTNTTNKALALSIGANQNGFPQKLKNGRLTILEKKTIAKAANSEFIAKFVFPDGKEITGDSLKEILEKSADSVGMSMRRLAYEFRIVKDNIIIKPPKPCDRIYQFYDKKNNDFYIGTVTDFLKHIKKSAKYKTLKEIQRFKWFTNRFELASDNPILSDSQIENEFEALGIKNVFFNFYSSRLKNDKFTDSEIEQLAAILGAEYQNQFILKDGTII